MSFVTILRCLMYTLLSYLTYGGHGARERETMLCERTNFQTSDFVTD